MKNQSHLGQSDQAKDPERGLGVGVASASPLPQRLRASFPSSWDQS